MKLPSSPFKKQKIENEYYLSLLLRDEKVTAVIFANENSKIRALASHEAFFETGIEHAEMEELLDVFDKAVSIAESKLSQNLPQVEKTIFAVKESWIENEKIKKEYLAKLKKVCEELSLQPIGFLVFSEATAHLLEKQEGAPVSAIFVEVGKNIVTTSLLKAGKVTDTKSAPIETFTVSHIVDSLLRHFTDHEVLPTKIIVQNDNVKTEKDNIQLEHEFAAHSWNKQLPFLHTPQIVMLPLNFETQTVLYGAATQMGLSVEQDFELPKVVDSNERLEEEPTNEEAEEEKTAEQDEELALPQEGENFGFVSNTDIALSKAESKASHPKLNLEASARERAEETSPHNENILAAMEDEEVAENESQALPTQAFLMGGAMKGFFAKLPLILPFFAGKKVLKKGKLIFALPVLAVLIILAIVFYIMFVKTTVSIAIAPDVKSQDQKVTFTTSGSSDFFNNILASQTVSANESGTGTAPATGKKDVGDKAKGTITIYNGTDQTKTYDAGTTITSGNGLKFTLDKAVSVASASGDVISGTKSGKTDASVTASDIGTKYNLPSGIQFSVNSDSTADVKAQNGSAFSGGTQKTVTVVSQADIDKATKQLMDAVTGKAQKDLSGKLSQNQALLTDTSSSTISNKKLSHQLNDPASSVTITGDVVYKAQSYDKNELNDFGKQLLKSKGKSNQTFDTSSISANIQNSKTLKNGDISATLSIKGNFLPQIDTNTVINSITNKSFADATRIVMALPQVSSVSITLHPNLPFLPKRTSLKSSNITVITHNE